MTSLTMYRGYLSEGFVILMSSRCPCGVTEAAKHPRHRHIGPPKEATPVVNSHRHSPRHEPAHEPALLTLAPVAHPTSIQHAPAHRRVEHGRWYD